MHFAKIPLWPVQGGIYVIFLGRVHCVITENNGCVLRFGVKIAKLVRPAFLRLNKINSVAVAFSGLEKLKAAA